MRALCALAVCLALLFPSSGVATTYTVEPFAVPYFWYMCGSMDTIRILPGTCYVELDGSWPLQLTSNSPALVGIGGPEGVTFIGTSVERAFYLSEFTYDAHIHFEQLTFSGLAEIIGREDPMSGGCGALHFTDNIVEECGTGPLYPPLNAADCWGTIARNTFRNNSGPAIVIYHTSASIEDNEIYENDSGIKDWCCTSPTIRGNHVHDNLQTGIATGYYEGGAIEYNLIEGNGAAGLAVGNHFTVQHNVIRGNAVGVSSCSWTGSGAAIHYNDIYDNTEWNLRASYEYDRTLDCTMNWWGSVDPPVIADGIQDCYDDPELHVCVLFEPFCTSPGCEPTPVEARSWGSIKALFRR